MLVDPHGDLVERIVARVPADRKSDVIFLDVPNFRTALRVQSTEACCVRKASACRVRPPRGLRKNVARGLGCPDGAHFPECAPLRPDQPQATLPDILRLFTDKKYRKEAIQHIKNPQVRKFWEDEYEKYTDRMRSDGFAPIQNKIGAFLANPTLYRIFTAPEKPINIRRIMDEGKVLLVNPAKGADR